jgi:hypothetical protein
MLCHIFFIWALDQHYKALMGIALSPYSQYSHNAWLEAGTNMGHRDLCMHSHFE